MLLARKLMLLAIMALAALAMSATSAVAEDEVEVSQEATGEHCSEAVLCETSVHSEAPPPIIRAHLLSGPEVTSSICNDEFHAVIETGSGEGYLDQQIFTGASCPNKPCGATNQASGDGAPWPIHMHETEDPLSNHEFGMDILFCLSPNQPEPQPQRFCHLEVGFNQEPMTHQYELEAEGPDGDGIPCGPGSTAPPAGVRVLEVDGHWITEDEAIEVEHAID